MRRAKIVCTLGPATSTADQILGLVNAGMDVARLNLSHGTQDQHRETYAHVRAAADATGRGVGILADLQGPKIRLGTFAGGPVHLLEGREFVVTTDDVPGDAAKVSTTYDGLAGDVKPGDCVLIDDGRVQLEVTRIEGPDVHTRVVVGGKVSNHKGFNLPGVRVSAPTLTEKDVADLRFAMELRADMIALSFVRSATDIEAVHAVMDSCGARLPVIAKLEKPEAVEQLAEIVEAFDGVMVARGDLGVEVPLEDVPIIQDRVVQLCRARAKPCIVATQMLESMVSAPRPTRAEVSDVATAATEGADALMLSAETSVGEYPVRSVETMARILTKIADVPLPMLSAPPAGVTTRGGAIARAAADVGAAIGARYLVAFTQNGGSAKRLARHRSPIPLLAFTPTPEVRSQLSVAWGMETFLVEEVRHTDDMIKQVDSRLLELGRCQAGDLVVIVAGSPPGRSGTTNMMRVHRISSE